MSSVAYWLEGRILQAVVVGLALTARGASADTSTSFPNDVLPILDKAGCNTAECHGSSGGKGGLRLSLFSGEPRDDFEALTRAAGGRRINRIEPEKSLLLLKITQALPHAMAQPLKTNSPEYQTLLSWVQQGTPWGPTNAPTVQKLTLDAGSGGLALKPGESRSLTVRADFSNGTQKTVTHWTHFRSSAPGVAMVGEDGTVKAVGYGETLILATALRHSDARWLVVPRPGTAKVSFVGTNRLDTLVGAKLQQLGVPPSGPCGDAEFLRRVYLDTIGILPTASEAKAFLSDKDPGKRAKLIDGLLARDEFADFWALKWGDLLRIKSEYPVRVWPKGVAAYYRWVHESIAENKPYDQFARELLTGTGSNFRDGPCNFMRAVPTKDPQTIAESAALVFMGARLSCARCHAHPSENWGLGEDLGMAAFFSKVNFKSTLEWKEEIVFLDPKGAVRNPRTRELVAPKLLDGTAVTVGKEEDPRIKFADWLTAPENPWFARNAANRVWFWLMGRGLVQEPDDMRPSNPPSNPLLLDYLARELTDHHYDLKQLYRLILNSRTYQLSSEPTDANREDTTHFSHYLVKRLTAEQLLDAVSQITETSEKFSSKIPEPFSYWPAGSRATQLSDGNVECSFLEMFGRPSRDTPYEEERDSEPSLRQELYFLNSEQLDTKISTGQRMKRLLQGNKSDAEIIDEIFLSALSRYPTAAEKEKLAAYIAKNSAARATALKDVLWAALNTKEFLFNH